MARRLACIVLAGIVATGCGKNAPPEPAVSGAGAQGQTITGRERIGWDQRAIETEDLATFRFAIYVDGNRSEVVDATCGAGSASTIFACSGKMPPMSAGTHTLEMSTFISDASGILESAKSAPLRVTMQAATAGEANAPVPWVSGAAGTTAEGIALAVERVADGLIDPVDLASAPDGRIFVAERSGRVLGVLPDGAAVADAIDVDGGQLVSVALDAAFERTHHLFALYSAPSATGVRYRLARYREVNGVLGERAVLMNDIAPAASPAAASLRVASDGRLLIALGRDVASGSASFDGKLLRVEVDGTTPPDQTGTPVIAEGLDAPLSSAWDRARSSLWIINRGAEASVLSSIVVAPSQEPRPALSYRLPQPAAESVAVYAGTRLPGFENNLLLASAQGRHILRLRLPDDSRGRQFATEMLLRDRVGRIELVTSGADGAIYFATGSSLGRIVPAGR